MIERKITAALRVDTDHVRLPNDLLDRVKREAAQPKRRWWSAWLQGRASKVVVAAVALMLLAGAGREIFHANPSPSPPPQKTYNTVAPQDLSSAVGFNVKMPSYVPNGLPLFDSRTESDSMVAEIIYMNATAGDGIMMQVWKSDQAAPFPTGIALAYRAALNQSVDINGSLGRFITYVLSGQTINRIYWNVDGVNYAVSAVNSVSTDELLKMARSVR